VGWCIEYEILGDDIVIFNKELAEAYLALMRELGVEINLSKSISAAKKPVFEFAKRTVVNGVNVSPIPFKQLLSQYSLGARVADAFR